MERETYEKAQEKQKVIRERRMTAAATHVQALFRGYWYDRFICCCDSTVPSL